MRCIATWLVGLTAMIAAVPFQSEGGERPALYIHLVAGTEAVDQLVIQAYQNRYDIRQIAENESAHQPPELIAGSLPNEAQDASGQRLRGYVLAVYVISETGMITDPVVVKTTDERLNPTAISALRAGRFKPAKLNGKPIALAAAQEFTFE